MLLIIHNRCVNISSANTIAPFYILHNYRGGMHSLGGGILFEVVVLGRIEIDVRCSVDVDDVGGWVEEVVHRLDEVDEGGSVDLVVNIVDVLVLRVWLVVDKVVHISDLVIVLGGRVAQIIEMVVLQVGRVVENVVQNVDQVVVRGGRVVQIVELLDAGGVPGHKPGQAAPHDSVRTRPQCIQQISLFRFLK